VRAHRGYRSHPNKVEPPALLSPDTPEMRDMKANVRSRHEMINDRLKNWGTLKETWRHHHTHHGITFQCLSMEIDILILQVEYNTPRIGNNDRLEDHDELNAGRFEFRNC